MLAVQKPSFGYNIQISEGINNIAVVEQFNDETRKMRLKEVLKKTFLKSKDTNKGLTKTAVWLHIPLSNPDKKTVYRILEIDNPLLKQVDFFLVNPFDKKSIKHQVAGLAVPLSAWPIKNHSPSFKVKIGPQKKVDVYLRVTSQSALFYPLKLYSKKEFDKKRNSFRFRFGVYYGIIFGILIFNLLMFVTFKDKLYLYESALTTTVHLGLIPFTLGVNTDLILSDDPQRFIVFACLTQIYSILFLTLGLENIVTEEKRYQSIRVFKKAIFLLAAFLSIKACFIKLNSLDLRMTIYIMAVAIFTIFGTAVHSALNGNRATKMFLRAWLAIALGGLGYLLLAFGISDIYWIRYLLPLGAIVQASMLSLAIRKKIKSVKESFTTMENEVASLKNSLNVIAPPDLAKKLIANPQLLIGPPTTETITVIYAEIDDNAARLDNERAETFHFESERSLEMVRKIIRKKGGILEHSLGRGVLGFFGYMRHSSLKEQVSQALQCAIEIQQQAIDEILEFGDLNLKTSFKVAINTSQALVGNTGTATNPEFTLSGKGVVDVQWLSMAAEPFKIMIANTTYEALNQPEICLEKQIPFNVAGDLRPAYEFDPHENGCDKIRIAKSFIRKQEVSPALIKRWPLKHNQASLNINDQNCLLLNFSTNGLSFSSQKYWGIGAVLKASIQASNNSLMTSILNKKLENLKVRVRWSNRAENGKYLHGAAILEPNDVSRKELESFFINLQKCHG